MKSRNVGPKQLERVKMFYGPCEQEEPDGWCLNLVIGGGRQISTVPGRRCLRPVGGARGGGLQVALNFGRTKGSPIQGK